MLLSLLFAVLYPALVSSKGRYASLRGALLGSVLAIVVGFFLPTTVTTSASRTTPIRIAKHYDASTNNHTVCQVTAISDQRQLENYSFNLDDAVVKVGDGHNYEFSTHRITFAKDWMWIVAARYPSEVFELTVPPEALANAISGMNEGADQVLFTNMPSPSTGPSLVNVALH